MRSRFHLSTPVESFPTLLPVRTASPARARRDRSVGTSRRRFSRFTALLLLASGVGALVGCGGGGGGGADKAKTLPAAPRGIVLTPGPGSLAIAWQPVADATAYAVYVSTSPSVNDKNYGSLPDGLHVPGVAATHVDVHGLRPGATFYVVIAAENGAGFGALSAPVHALLAPGMPVDVRSAGGMGSVRIAWEAKLGAVSYDLYFAKASGVSDTNFASLPDGRHLAGIRATNAQIDGLVEGEMYFARVSARNATGVGPLSATIEAIVSPGLMLDMRAIAGVRSMRVEWEGPVGATAFDLVLATDATVDADNYATLPDGQRLEAVRGASIVIDELREGETYFVRVAARNGGGVGAFHAPVAATLAPGMPVDVVARGGVGVLTVAWGAMRGAASYDLYLATHEGVNADNYADLPDGQHIEGIVDTTIAVEMLRDGATYFARVLARNAAGASELCVPVSAVLAPGIPADVTAVPGIGLVTLAWPATPGAEVHDVYLARDPAISSENWESLDGGARIVAAVSGAEIPDLANGVAYWFVVVARNGAGRGADSVAVSAAPSARGTFAEAGTLAAGAAVAASVSADFNGDGKLDLALLDGLGAKVRVFPSLGDGSFDAPIELEVGSYAMALAAADLNGDGAIDLVSTNTADGSVSVMLADGLGGFLPRAQYAAGANPIALAIASIDSADDAIPDLIVTDGGTHEVLFLRGVGDGSFASAIAASVGTFPAKVVIGDWNGDGALDLATANRDSNDVTTLLGDGHGAFASRIDVPVGVAPAMIEARDFDGNGYKDLIVATSGDGGLVLLRGAGDGSFAADAQMLVGTEPSGFVSGDFNGDGALDLAIADPTEGTVRILLGDVLGIFQPFFVLNLPDGPVSLCLSDFDGDGILDLAASNEVDGTVTLLIGSDV